MIWSVERERHPTCVVCGDRVGVFEPTIVFAPEGESRRCTSLAREPLLWRDASVSFAHPECWEDWSD